MDEGPDPRNGCCIPDWLGFICPGAALLLGGSTCIGVGVAELFSIDEGVAGGVSFLGRDLPPFFFGSPVSISRSLSSRLFFMQV